MINEESNWSQVKTGAQKDKLIELTKQELDKLKESGILEGLLHGQIEIGKTIGNDYDRYWLYLSREGKLTEMNYYKTHGDWEDRSWTVKEEDVADAIKKYELTPKKIKEISETLIA